MDSPESNNFCKICKMTVTSGKNDRNWIAHQKSRPHLRNLPVFCLFRNISPDLHTKEIRNYCERFGEIFQFNSNASSVTVSFRNPADMFDFTQEEHVINGVEVEITWRKPKAISEADEEAMLRKMEARWKKRSEPNIKDHTKNNTNNSSNNASKAFRPSKDILVEERRFQTAIVEKLKRDMGFNEAHSLIIQQLNNEHSRTNPSHQSICEDFRDVLPEEAKVTLYGSRFTKLNIHTSDFNYHISHYKSLSDLREALVGRFTQFAVIYLRHGKFLHCIHRSTNSKCELTIGKMAPVYKSQFLRFYFHLDKKCIPFVLFLRFWFQARCNFLLDDFTAYCLDLLVIFFLQQKWPETFLSIKKLQEEVSAKIDHRYNFAFSAIVPTKAIDSEVTAEEMFEQFLNFYLDFDFFRYDVNTYEGRPVEKAVLFEDSKMKYIPDALVSIQDPFEHHFSVLENKYTSIAKIQVAFGRALKQLKYRKPIYELIIDDNMVLNKKYEIYNFKPPKTSENYTRQWCDKVRNIVIKMCTKVMQGQVVQIPESQIQCSDVPIDDAGDALFLSFSMSPILFHGRIRRLSKIWKELKEKGGRLIDQDADISYSVTPKERSTLQVFVDLIFRDDPCECFIIVGFGMAKKMFGETVYTFLRHKLPLWIDEIQIDDTGSPSTSSAEPLIELEKCANFQKTSDDDFDRIDAEADEMLDQMLLDDSFLDGLEVVDAVDDEEHDADAPPSPPRNRSRSRSPSPPRRSHSTRNRSRSRRRSRSPSSARRHRAPPAATYRTARRGELVAARRKSPERHGSRRDPEKTRRDITRDKARVSRDEEKKTQLEILHGGLVPPGLEAEAMAEREKRERSWERVDGGAKRAKRNDSSRRELKKYHESFLKEVREKLNEVQQPVKTVYDETFFIGGTTYPTNQLNQAAPQQWSGGGGGGGNMQFMQPVNQRLNPVPSTGFDTMFNPSGPTYQNEHLNVYQQQNFNNLVETTAQEVTQVPNACIEVKRIELKQSPVKSQNAGQLFAEKKISLSDFLTISAKPEVQTANTEQLQKKIEVISRVQEVIRTMSDDRNFKSGIIVRPTNDSNSNAESKRLFSSPLLRSPIINFLHTTTPDASMSCFESAVLHILRMNGIDNASLRLDPNDVVRNDRKQEVRTVRVVEECKDCKRRQQIEYATIGTQVSDRDFGIGTTKAKQQESLMHLTPAQLLGIRQQPQAQQASRPRGHYNSGGFQNPRNYQPNQNWY